MNDRTLLELAAKAAGIEINPIDAAHEPDDWVCWNPLMDDGDAFRLAVKQCFLVAVFGGGTFSKQHVEVLVSSDNKHNIDIRVDIEGDPYTSTRRAIVLAAAAIGKEMP